MGAVMFRAIAAPVAVLLDLPDHQLFRVVGALVGAELRRRGIGSAGREMPPDQQQRALADRTDAFGAGAVEDHAGSGDLRFSRVRFSPLPAGERSTRIVRCAAGEGASDERERVPHPDVICDDIRPLPCGER